tara:strand:- start:309 stop:578 length:270 start_codon:yes stop_codon:yes gene_type:complete
MAFKMKGPTFFQTKKKTQENYLNEGFTLEDADKMMESGATTGRQEESKPPNDDMAYFNELEAKEKAGKLSDNEKKALARLRSQKEELKK